MVGDLFVSRVRAPSSSLAAVLRGARVPSYAAAEAALARPAAAADAAYAAAAYARALAGAAAAAAAAAEAGGGGDADVAALAARAAQIGAHQRDAWLPQLAAFARDARGEYVARLAIWLPRVGRPSDICISPCARRYEEASRSVREALGAWAAQPALHAVDWARVDGRGLAEWRVEWREACAALRA